MTATPDVSVVMSVYNGALNLQQTIDSILAQEGVSLEFIIVNDGSTDETPQILEEHSKRDSRIRVIHQENQGLTKALIRGCAEAKADYIARQDAGDTSLPDRLVKQLSLISRNPDTALVSCGTRFVGPEHEYLYDIIPDSGEATKRLLALSLEEIKGPSIHGCTMFSRPVYERVGGYRPEFYFAQDLDLWIRMAEQASHLVIPEALYEASLTLGAISSLYRKEQVATAQLILNSARARRDFKDDKFILEEAKLIKPGSKRKIGRGVQADALYFIGMCLRKNKSPRATNYFKQALLSYPFHFKAAVRLLLG